MTHPLRTDRRRRLAGGCLVPAGLAWLWLAICSPLAGQEASYGYGGSGASPAAGSRLAAAPPPARYEEYSYSAIELGQLSAEGFDDLAAYRPRTVADGDFRQPTAIELLNDHQALITTRLSGQLILLNLDDLGLHTVLQLPGRQWAAIQMLEPSVCAVIDTANDEVVIVEAGQPDWRVLAVLPVPGRPHSLAWNGKAGTLYVSGQWSQRLFGFTAADAGWQGWEPLPATDLPFCGGGLLWLNDQQMLIVMAAFGRDYVVLDGRGTDRPLPMVNHARLYGHNVPRLVTVDDGAGILLPMQLLNPETNSIRGEITWGNVLSNNLRRLHTPAMLYGQGVEIFQGSRFIPLGSVGNGAGDPTNLRLGSDGQLAVTLGGTDRVALGRLDEREWRQFPVGLRPVDCVFTPAGDRLVVVNQFSDDLSIVDCLDGSVAHVPLGPLRPPTLIERGERLFFHARLSHDSWMSCHSCHSHGHTNGLLNDNMTDGTLGTPKRILSLLGQADTGPYGWTGTMTSLEQQILHSLQSTMATDVPISREMVDALAAYLRSLAPPPGVRVARGEPVENSMWHSGQALFQGLGCADCHAGTELTSAASYDVALADERDQRLYNPPSLRGVSQRDGALFHDGRARSLAAVIVEYQHQLPRPLEADEVAALLTYLQSL